MRNYPYPNPETTICASLSSPSSGNKAIYMHNAGYEFLGLNNMFLSLDTKDMGMACRFLKTINWKGYSIGMPNKQAIIKYLDETDSSVKKIGACNTVFNDNGKLIGYNSDYIGAINCLKQRLDIHGKKVLVLGAGGTTRAIIFGLKQYDCNITILNRNTKKADVLASEFGVRSGSINDESKYKNHDIIINATPVGSRGREDCDCLLCKFLGLSSTFTTKSFSFDIFKENKIALDVVFQRNETEFTQKAKFHKYNVIHGYEMLVEQGAFQFKLFTGVDAPKDIMYTALQKYLD